jgi:hypothetical protein
MGRTVKISYSRLAVQDRRRWRSGGGGGCERFHIYLTHIGDSMVRVTRLGPISEKDVTRRTVGFNKTFQMASLILAII